VKIHARAKGTGAGIGGDCLAIRATNRYVLGGITPACSRLTIAEVWGEGMENTKKHKETCEKANKNMFAYTLPSFLLFYLKKHPSKLIPASEIIQEFEATTNRKITKRAIQIAIRRLEKKGKITVKRSEQLYVQANNFLTRRVRTPSRREANKSEQERTTPSENASVEKRTRGLTMCEKTSISSAQNNISYHAVKIKIKIKKHGGIPVDVLEKLKKNRKYSEKRVRNWVKRYFYFEEPIPLTAELTPRSLIIHLKEKQFKKTEFKEKSKKYVELAVRGITNLFKKYEYTLDNDYKIIAQHIGSQTEKEIDEKIEAGTTVSVNLNRKAISHTGEMKQEATAWLDKSLGFAEIETNDLTYEEKLILMPEIIHKALPLLVAYSRQVERHLEVLEQMSITLKNIDEGIKIIVKNCKRR